MMVNSFKLKFCLTLEALVELFSRCISEGREGIKELRCPVSGLDRNTCDELLVPGLADYTKKKQSDEGKQILIFMLCKLDWYLSINK